MTSEWKTQEKLDENTTVQNIYIYIGRNLEQTYSTFFWLLFSIFNLLIDWKSPAPAENAQFSHPLQYTIKVIISKQMCT